RLALDDNGEVNARRPLQPLFELREDAMAMAEFDASRLWGDYGCDDERDGWWAADARGCKYRFVIEPAAAADAAAGIGLPPPRFRGDERNARHSAPLPPCIAPTWVRTIRR